MEFQRSILMLSALLLLTWGVLVPVSSADPPVLSDDFLRAVEEKTTYFQASDLLANDSVGDSVTGIEIIEWPTLGSLAHVAEREGGATDLFYTPSAVLAPTWDSFTYKPVDSALGTQPARVKIRVQPVRRPIAGRWQTLTCNEASCPATGELGQGAEIGWYHSVSAVFELCDWQGGGLQGCRSVALPFGYRESGLEPLVGDWDGDTWDEVAVYDPVSAAVHFFDVAPKSSESVLPDALVHLSSGFLGPGGLLTFTGVFEHGLAPVPEARFGWFDHDAEKFWLERPTGDLRTVGFGDSDKDQEPVIGDWEGDGLDDLGLWNPDSSELWIRGPEDVASVRTYEIRDSLSGLPVDGQPFAGPILDDSTRSYFGLYDPSIGKFRIYLLCSGICGTLPLQILVDPP